MCNDCTIIIWNFLQHYFVFPAIIVDFFVYGYKLRIVTKINSSISMYIFKVHSLCDV